MGMFERKILVKTFHDLVFAKIEGKITQEELEQRTRELTSEQLSLGIGASTEVTRERDSV